MEKTQLLKVQDTLPWEVGGPYPSVTVIYCVDAGRGSPDWSMPVYEAVCRLSDNTEGELNPQALAFAEFICRAVNSHAELLAACEEMLRTFDVNSGRIVSNTTRQELEPWLPMLREVVAKATGAAP